MSKCTYCGAQSVYFGMCLPCLKQSDASLNVKEISPYAGVLNNGTHTFLLWRGMCVEISEGFESLMYAISMIFMLSNNRSMVEARRHSREVLNEFGVKYNDYNRLVFLMACQQWEHI